MGERSRFRKEAAARIRMAQNCAAKDRRQQCQEDDYGPSLDKEAYGTLAANFHFRRFLHSTGVGILNSRPEPADEGHFLGLFARAGTGDTSFN